VLVQTSELRVPGHGARCRHAAMRGAGFALSMTWTSGLATDWGVQSRLVAYIARQTRCQLSIVLRGRGYVVGDHGVTLLRAGDVVELDQLRHDDEGYGGTPCEVLVIEWDHDGAFGAERRGAPRCSRLSASDTEALRALTDRMTVTPAARWVRDLVAQLRALGLPAPRAPDLALSTPPHAERLYRALGHTRESMQRQPSLSELADQLGLSERQVRRGLARLDGELGMAIHGWRDFLSDARLAWGQQLLSIPTLSMKQVAALSGFRSPVALSHAFSARSGGTPGDVARTLRERWR
jgi:AraC-like DNA-binding protein